MYYYSSIYTCFSKKMCIQYNSYNSGEKIISQPLLYSGNDSVFMTFSTEVGRIPKVSEGMSLPRSDISASATLPLSGSAFQQFPGITDTGLTILPTFQDLPQGGAWGCSIITADLLATKISPLEEMNTVFYPFCSCCRNSISPMNMAYHSY